METRLLQRILLMLLLVTLEAGSIWADDLTEYYNISGYESYNKTFFNFKTNSPAVLPTSGDLRYREGYGLHNFGSGPRSAVVSIPVASGDLLVLQQYNDAYPTTINRGSKNDALSSSTGFQCFNISEDANDITISTPRYGGVIAVLVFSQKYSYIVNASDGANTLRTIATGIVSMGSSVTISYPQYILKDNTLYNIANNGSGNWFIKDITPNQNLYTETLYYTNGTVSNVVYYQEGEDITGVNQGTNDARASQGKMGYTNGFVNITNLIGGAYRMSWRGVNGNSSATRRVVFKAGETEIYSFDIPYGTDVRGTSGLLNISAPALSFSCEGSGQSGLDWFYVQAVFAYKEATSSIPVGTSHYRPDMFLPDYNESAYTFTSDNEAVATVDWNGIVARNNGTATITAKRTIDGVEYVTTHTVTVTGQSPATTEFDYNEYTKTETYRITGDGYLPEYDDGTAINIGYGSTNEIQTSLGNYAHCEDINGFWHAHLDNSGIPDMGTYYIIRPKLGYHGKISINAYVDDDNGTRNGIRLVDKNGTLLEQITNTDSGWGTYSFNWELIDGETYYLFAETGAMSGAKNAAYSNLQLQSLTFTRSNYSNTSDVIQIPSNGQYVIPNGTGLSNPAYSIVSSYGELAGQVSISGNTLYNITAGGAVKIGLTENGYTAYHLLTVAYPATDYPGHLWDFNIEGSPMTTADILRTVPVPPNTALGNSGDTWTSLYKVDTGSYTRAPEWRLNRAINGDNVLVVPETAGLLFNTDGHGFYMRNDDETFRHVGIHSNGASFTIPLLKAGDIVELNWKHDAGNNGSTFSATNLKDLRNKIIPTDDTFLITESAYRTQFNHPGRYSFIVAADGDVTFTLKDAGYTDILSIRIYEGPYRSTMHNIDLSGGDAAPTEALLDNIGNTEDPNYKQFTYNYCNPLYSTATGPAMYVIKGYEAGKGFNHGVDADKKGNDNPNDFYWYDDPDAYPIDDADELARLIDLRKNLVGLKVENHPWKSQNNAYNNGYIAATSGWGKVTVRMNNYTNDMKYVIGYTPDYTITFGSAPHQEYPYTWDFTHISAQQVTGLATNAYNSIRNDWYTTNWDTSAEGVSLLNVDNSGDTGSQYVPGAILVTTERALSKYSVPEDETALYALDELDGLGVNGQIAIHGDLTQNASRTRATIVELLKYNLDDGFTATTELTAGSGTVYFGADKYVTIDHSQVDATNDHSYQLDGGGSKYIRLTLPYGVNFEAGNTITIKAYSNKANGGVTLHQSAETDSEETAYLKATLTLANKYAEETLTYTVSAGDGIEGQHQVWIYRANGNTTFVTEMSVKGTSDEIPVINKMLYAASETTLTIPDLNADGKQDWIYVSASAAPSVVTNATIVTSGTDGPDANQSPELEDSNAKVYKYKVDGNSKINAYLTFAAGTKIYKIGVTHILKDIHSVGGTGWATEIRKHEIDHELTGYFTKNDVNAYVVTYDSYDMKTATVALTPINEDGYVPTKTGVVMKLDNVSGLTDANNGMNVPLFCPSYTRPQTTTPVDFPTNNRMYNVDEGIENNNRNGNEQYYNLNESGVNYTKFVLTNVHWTYTVNNNSDSWSGPIENQDAAGFYRLHIWNDEKDIMPAHNAFMLVETDNLPRALWEQYPSSARQNTIGIRSDGDNGVTDINEVKVINSEGYIADDIDEAPWFTLSGMKLSTRPTQPGLYIYNNRKVVIK